MVAGGPVGFAGGMVKRKEIAQDVLQLKIVLVKLSLRQFDTLKPPLQKLAEFWYCNGYNSLGYVMVNNESECRSSAGRLCVSWKLGKKWRLYLVALYVVAEGADGAY